MYLPSIFSDHMVVQHGVELPVWGWADAGKTVTVRLGDQVREVRLAESGRWQVRLDPIAVGSPRTLTVSDGDETVSFADVIAGDVWVCSGQSNMGWPVQSATDGDRIAEQANCPDIRFFDEPHVLSGEPQIDIEMPRRWHTCTPESARLFPAVGYLFGRAIRDRVDVPIGLIHNAIGGAPCDIYVSRDALSADADFAPILDRYDFIRAHHRKAKQQREASATSTDPPVDPATTKACPAGAFNGIIAPIIPYAIRGVIWYQGESNVDRAFQYRKLFAALIEDWRRHWGQGNFPFLFVQLPNYEADGGRHTQWAELREAQQMALRLPNTAMVVTIDAGVSDDIHPPDKRPAARRLADVALREVYGRDVQAYGPMYRSHEANGRGFRVEFSHADGGLMTSDGAQPRGFALAGSDRQFVDAEAVIESKQVVVQNDQVADPVAVRYAWCNDPAVNLCNQAGMPVAPFRTDDWPGVTDSCR